MMDIAMWRFNRSEVPLEEQQVREKVGSRLRTLREQAGLTQRELGERAGGLRAGEISRYEHAHRSPSLETLARLATGLSLPVSTMIDIDEPVPTDAALGPLAKRVQRLQPRDRARVVAVLETLVRELER